MKSDINGARNRIIVFVLFVRTLLSGLLVVGSFISQMLQNVFVAEISEDVEMMDVQGDYVDSDHVTFAMQFTALKTHAAIKCGSVMSASNGIVILMGNADRQRNLGTISACDVMKSL